MQGCFCCFYTKTTTQTYLSSLFRPSTCTIMCTLYANHTPLLIMPNILSGDILFLLELMVIRGRNNKHALCGNSHVYRKSS